MERLVSNILDYLDYLKENHKLSISIHFNKEYSMKCYFGACEKLAYYNAHLNPYCLKVKSENGGKCILCQRAIFNKIRRSPAFIGICHADVKEYVHAIYKDTEGIGFISVSGFKADAFRYRRDAHLQQIYDLSLNSQMPPEELLNQIIPPLCSMLELLLNSMERFETFNFDTKTSDYQMILNFLRENHTNVSLAKLSKQFNYSKSYISHLFKKNNKNTLLHYCNILKVNDAKHLLNNTAMTVTEIALTVGFNDLSYFINTFKRITGKTPLAWRKS